MTDITTRSPFPYWIGCSTPDLIASADEYEQAVNEGRFADDPDAGVRLLATAADIRTEIARRQNEHWHGHVRHSHPSGQEPHDHEESGDPPPLDVCACVEERDCPPPGPARERPAVPAVRLALTHVDVTAEHV